MGLDVDLEGPAINQDYGKFITDLSAGLRARGKLLTAALSHMNGADKVSDDAMHLFDFINIMAYDATGPWCPAEPGQHSSFDFAKESLDYWTKRGLPKDKAILGVPFYGYGFGADRNEGIGYVVDGELGGVMIWQLAHDASGPHSLLLAIDQVINKNALSNEK